MDSAVQRRNMVNSQVRPSDVTDRRIPRAMLAVPREAFVPEALRVVAYMDGNLVVTGNGERPARALLAPRTLAKMIQELALEPAATVLDVAPATGYSTAVLSKIASKVVAVEHDTRLAERARSILHDLGISNAEVHVGEPREGSAQGPYDAILVGGKVADIPSELLDQLKDGGRLVAILDLDGVGKAYEWRRFATSFDRRPLFDAEAPFLPGFERVSGFVF